MSQERFAEFLRGIDASLALNSDLRDAHDTYLTGIEQQRESTARQILRLLPASYRFDAARLSFLPRPTPELVALLSLREKSAKAIAAAERRLLDAVATATPDAHRASFARATLAWRLEQLPAEQLLPSTRLTLVEFVGELRLDAGTAEALASTVGEYATALARALDTGDAFFAVGVGEAAPRLLTAPRPRADTLCLVVLVDAVKVRRAGDVDADGARRAVVVRAARRQAV
jgi:hypothetical protein